MNMNQDQIDKAARIIRRAQESLGRTLKVGERTDLLLDNMPELQDSAEARRLVYLTVGSA